MTAACKVSLIITAHNYGRYLRRCLDSALGQHFSDFEVIVVNDGSTDNTREILHEYDGRISVVELDGIGLAGACNKGIEAANGQYIIRLDADDYFDENILMIESNILDRNPDISMVFPDYYTINIHGEIIEHVRLMKVNDEVKFLDRSPLAAGAMFRKSCFTAIGGYDASLKYQEDYDFWMRFTNRYKVYNVNLPLMYYRRHASSMSSHTRERMQVRRHVKRKFVQQHRDLEKKRILALVPARSLSRFGKKLVIRKLGDDPLLAYTIREAVKTPGLDRVIVSTDDEEIADVARCYGAEVPFLRPKRLIRYTVRTEEIVLHALHGLKDLDGYAPDIVAILHVVAPFKTAEHIAEAIHTLLVYHADSVISVTKDTTSHWRPGINGLEPVGYKKGLLKEDKHTIYKDNGAIYVANAINFYKNDMFGQRIGHIEMFPEESIHLDSEWDFWIASRMIESRTRPG